MAALRENASLIAHHDRLLFERAYPVDARALALTERELRRISSFLRARHAGKRSARTVKDGMEGLPFISTVSRYSHDCVRWLLAHPDCHVDLEAFADATLDLNAVLRLTLPRAERSETNAELSNDELLDALGVRERERLSFLVAELSRLDATPFVKDQLFDALGVEVRVRPGSAAFSVAFNRLPMNDVFYQSDKLRQFDAAALMKSALPSPRTLGARERDEAVRIIRNTMTLTLRETDPATYMDTRSLRLFDLERGVSVAIFTMTHDRQLALESYVGFTAFKNGMPVSYGGSWVLGDRADFGMNIFAPYRGGESGYVMCQLLRVYRQQFGVRYFEVDAHQFGLDNEEGIETGAFWFYWRYGFRPIDRATGALAGKEKTRLSKRAGSRSSTALLRRFTNSNVALNFGGAVPATLYDITTRVTQFVKREYASDRTVAERDAVQRFVAETGVGEPANADERDALADWALQACALGVHTAAQWQRVAEIVRAKPVDVYEYQRLLTEFLATGVMARKR